MDWAAQIRVGNARVRVYFTGGTLTVYGVTPAKYETSDVFIQRVIEQSRYFKEGRIVKLKEIELGDEPKKEREDKKVSEEMADVNESTEAEDAVEQESEGMKEIEVTCLQDAMDYLQAEYGINSYKIRTRATAQAAAQERGIVFVGGGF